MQKQRRQRHLTTARRLLNKPFKRIQDRKLRWFIIGIVVLLIYALLKTITKSSNVIAMWLNTFVITVENIVVTIAAALISPVGLIVIACLWLIKTGDMYRLLNKLRYLKLSGHDEIKLYHRKTESEPELHPSLINWEKNIIRQLENSSSEEERQRLLDQLSAYHLFVKRPEVLSLLQFLYYYRRDDISFFQIAQFLISEGYLDDRHLSNHELDLEAIVLGYISHLEHNGFIEAYVTLSPTQDGFYGTVHKVKVPQHIQEVMERFS